MALGIETSCDETAIALLHVDGNRGKVIGEEISSQTRIHRDYGGVVPELASREHLGNLPLLLDRICKLLPRDVRPAIIGVTSGPGLKGCLLTGMAFADGLARGWRVPLIGINHIEGHLHAARLDNPELEPPYLALVVSGGHTEIVHVRGLGDYAVIARTGDDAAGECFDKSANLLGFEYPGGAALAALADSVPRTMLQTVGDLAGLPRVMQGASGFSFSGLKTAIALLVRRERDSMSSDPSRRAQIAAAIQEAIVDALVVKVHEALARLKLAVLVVTGGVAANRRLRERVAEFPGVRAYFPSTIHCTDNAAMIAYVAALRASGPRSPLEVRSRWPVEECLPPSNAAGAP